MAEEIGKLIATALGLMICLAVLATTYQAGSWLAWYTVGEQHREASGLLTALAVVWFYEHYRWEERWNSRRK